jgi:hypothetical protein
VPVREFRLYRTRSAVAARSFETMGPAFAVVPAALAPVPADPVTGERLYRGSVAASFPASWDDWLVRAVAVPDDLVPVEAVRGLLSPAGEAVAVTMLPDLAPDLAALTADVWGAASDGVVVRTSTSAPVRAVALGSHRLSGAAGSRDVAPIALETVPAGEVVNLAAPPAGAAAAPVLVRGPRAGGRTPLALWFRRPVAADPVEVVLRIADPLGRVTERRITVPGWTPPAPPPPSLTLIDVTTIAGRGTVLRLRSDASVTAAPPFVLEVVAQPTGVTFIRLPGRPPLPIRQPAQRASFPLPSIPRTATPFPVGPVIQAVRTTTAPPHEYQVLVRVAPPFTATVSMVAPNGARTTVTREVT